MTLILLILLISVDDIALYVSRSRHTDVDIVDIVDFVNDVDCHRSC